MNSVITKAAAAFGLMGALYFAAGTTSYAGVENATFATVGDETSTPFGWVDFCQRYAGECQDDDRTPTSVDLTPANFNKLKQVNSWVNEHVKPVSDMEHWGVVDRWDYPTDGKGDCEDYALLKRHMLMEAGFPRQALLITVVKEHNGDGHAILTVKTNHGEYVLDNLSDRIKPWNAAPYRFVKRQSQQNQNTWVILGPPTTDPMYVSK